MFTKLCVIFKKSADIISKLKILGYNINYINDDADFIETSFINGHVLGVRKNEYVKSELTIECGINEQLFIAIASLRNDTDKYQWFIYDTTKQSNITLPSYIWFICTEDKIEDMLYYNSQYIYAHKATVEELIEHFKNKKQIK